MNIPDLIFAAASVVLVASLMPTLLSRTPVPRLSSVPIAVCLGVMATVLLTQGLVFGGSVTAVQSMQWATIAVRNREVV